MSSPRRSRAPRVTESRMSESGSRREIARWIADILACAPLSVRAIKQMVRAGERLSAKEAQMLRLPALIEALRSSDQDEGVRAFQGRWALLQHFGRLGQQLDAPFAPGDGRLGTQGQAKSPRSARPAGPVEQVVGHGACPVG